MKQRKKIKDWRSTGRKRGRKVLYEEGIDFACILCKRTSEHPPPDAPENFDDLWPKENRVLPYSLQVNHINKDYTDNDPSNLQWACAPCHKALDATSTAEETSAEQYGNFDF